MTWNEILADPDLRKLPHKIEQDEFGRAIMTPPPSPDHGLYDAEIVHLLKRLLRGWRVYADCSIQTAKGVRSPDIAAMPLGRAKRGWQPLPSAPAICVEILSPSNTPEEMVEKRQLLAQAGCEEFWLCSERGDLSFFLADGSPLARSRLCPGFPTRIELD